jgi:hypothetical protein
MQWKGGDNEENWVGVWIWKATPMGYLKEKFLIRLEVVTSTAKHASHTVFNLF